MYECCNAMQRCEDVMQNKENCRLCRCMKNRICTSENKDAMVIVVYSRKFAKWLMY
tara:strand:+ start:91 stop:258 length:168 start_codon:yes stop_codon:yes gene_type:complete